MSRVQGRVLTHGKWGLPRFFVSQYLPLSEGGIILHYYIVFLYVNVKVKEFGG